MIVIKIKHVLWFKIFIEVTNSTVSLQSSTGRYNESNDIQLSTQNNTRITWHTAITKYADNNAKHLLPFKHLQVIVMALCLRAVAHKIITTLVYKEHVKQIPYLKPLNVPSKVMNKT